MLIFLFTALDCAIVVGLFLVIGWYVYVSKYAKYMKNIPGPIPLPVFGNALMFTDSAKFMRIVTEIFESYGRIVRIWCGIEAVIMLSDNNAIKAALSSNKLIEKAKFYQFLHAWGGTGLITSPGPKWKRHRRMLIPTYHIHVLQQFIPTFNKVASQLVQKMKSTKHGHSLDIYPLMHLATLDIICETAMGVSINALENKDSKYVHSTKELSRITMERVVSPIQHVDFLYRFTQNYRTEQECLKIVNDHTVAVIKKRRDELLKNRSQRVEVVDDFGKQRKSAFLDLLLQTTDDGQPLSDDDIREEVNTMMAAGNDSTTSCICFTLFEIANNPAVQENILHELQDIFGSDDRDATYQDLGDMRYLEMAIKESLRMYPTVPIFARHVVEDIQITDDICCPKGSTIAVFAYHLHRDPTYYPEPDKFKPERFAAENQTGKSSYSFVPFGAGPRDCIGQKFAYMEMKCVISKILRCFEVRPVVPRHDLVLVPEIILKPKNGVWIQMHERV